MVWSSAYGRQGIIPADAGSTKMLKEQRMAVEDHPRGCGEHMPSAVDATMSDGSSPRMRGAPAHHEYRQQSVGIIPADAGSTLKDPCNPNNMIDKISDF